MTSKRRALSLDTKLEIILSLEKGRKRKEVAESFGIPYQSIVTIWNDRSMLKEKGAKTDFNKNSKKLNLSHLL